MTEYISRGDFTSDIAFNRYKAVLVEYKNLKQLKKRVEDRIIELRNNKEKSKSKEDYDYYEDMIIELQSILKGDTS